MRLLTFLMVLTAYVAVGYFFFQTTQAQILLGIAGFVAGAVIVALLRGNDEALDP